MELENQLKHCILAHHGELEYGSPKKPAMVEAVALNLADNADAKMETLTELFICNTLAQNPLYADLLDRRKIKVAQGLHHLDVLTRKLQNGNIPVPETVAQERYYLCGSKKA